MSISISSNGKNQNINNLDLEDKNSKLKDINSKEDMIPECLQTFINSLKSVNYEFYSKSLLSIIYSDVANFYLEPNHQKPRLAIEFIFLLSDILTAKLEKEEKIKKVDSFFSKLKDFDSVKKYPDYYKAIETILVEFSPQELQKDINHYTKLEKNTKLDTFKTFLNLSETLNQNFRSTLLTISGFVFARDSKIEEFQELYQEVLNKNKLLENDKLFIKSIKKYISGPDRLSDNELKDLKKCFHDLQANLSQTRTEFYQLLNFHLQSTQKIFNEITDNINYEKYKKAIETNDIKTLKKFQEIFDELEVNIKALNADFEIPTKKYLSLINLESNFYIYLENADPTELKNLFIENKTYQKFLKEFKNNVNNFQINDNLFKETFPENKFIIRTNGIQTLMLTTMMQTLRMFYIIDNSQTFNCYHSFTFQLDQLIKKKNTKNFFINDLVHVKPSDSTNAASQIESQCNKSLGQSQKSETLAEKKTDNNKLDAHQVKKIILQDPKIKFTGAAAQQPFENAQLYLSNLLSLWERIKKNVQAGQTPPQTASHVINTVINSNLALEQMYTALIAQRLNINEQKILQKHHSHDLITLYNLCDFKGIDGFTKEDLSLLVAANRSEILSRNIPTNVDSYNPKLDRAKSLMDQAFKLNANTSSGDIKKLLQETNKYSLDTLKSLIHLHRFFTNDLSDKKVIKNLEELYLEVKNDSIPNVTIKQSESQSKYPKIIAYLHNLSLQQGMSCQESIENVRFLLSLLECETDALQNAHPHEMSLIHSRILQLNQIIVEELLYLILETKGIYPKKSDIDHNLKQLINDFEFKIKFTPEENQFLEEGKKIRSITRYGAANNNNNNNNHSVAKTSKKSRRLAKKKGAKQEVAEGFSPVQTAQDKQALADMAKIKESVEADCKIFRSVVAKIIG